MHTKQKELEAGEKEKRDIFIDLIQTCMLISTLSAFLMVFLKRTSGSQIPGIPTPLSQLPLLSFSYSQKHVVEKEEENESRETDRRRK